MISFFCLHNILLDRSIRALFYLIPRNVLHTFCTHFCFYFCGTLSVIIIVLLLTGVKWKFYYPCSSLHTLKTQEKTMTVKSFTMHKWNLFRPRSWLKSWTANKNISRKASYEDVEMNQWEFHYALTFFRLLFKCPQSTWKTRKQVALLLG